MEGGIALTGIGGSLGRSPGDFKGRRMGEAEEEGEREEGEWDSEEVWAGMDAVEIRRNDPWEDGEGEEEMVASEGKIGCELECLRVVGWDKVEAATGVFGNSFGG